ncbi:MAG: branched-chain amino acid ABC transporter permease [Anaerolineales bacterium]|nr:branched-chain amino acid ABC transporter permease [Anaerolineales bacterium]
MLKSWLKRITPTDIAMWGIGLVILIAVIWGSIATLTSGKYTPSTWGDLFIYGLTLGSIYALIALGYTMVYGILRMINFAHSEVFMSGPFTAYYLVDYFYRSGFLDQHPVLSLTLVMLLAMGVSMVIALLVEKIAYRPLRNAPRLVPLITAIGASYFLVYTFRGLYGTGLQTYPDVAILQGSVNILGADVARLRLVVIVGAVIMMSLLYGIVMLTKVGKAMRAVSENKETAALMGINVDRIISITFALGGALAGAAGVLYALVFRQVSFYMGFIPGLKAFTAAVLGGIGNAPGAMLGGIFLGIIESVGPSLFMDGLGIPASNQLKDVIAFTLLVLVLIFRPSGILGERLTTKKA